MAMLQGNDLIKGKRILITPRERSTPLGTVALFSNSRRYCQCLLDHWTVAASLGGIGKNIYE